MKKHTTWLVKLKNQDDLRYFLVWFLVIFIIAVVFIWRMQNLLGGLAILSLGILYLRFYHESPQQKEVSIKKNGIKYGADLYRFSSILFFTLTKVRGDDYLVLLTSARIDAETAIKLPKNLQKEKIIEVLSRSLPFKQKISFLNAFHIDTYLGI